MLFAMNVKGETYRERKEAGRALKKEILTLAQLRHDGETDIASIRAFDLVYDAEKFGRGDNYHYQTLLQRTGADYVIELPVTVTPLGAISRLQHALDAFEDERERYRQRPEEYKRRLASYQSQLGGAFAFVDELAEKRHALREVEEALTISARADAETNELAA